MANTPRGFYSNNTVPSQMANTLENYLIRVNSNINIPLKSSAKNTVLSKRIDIIIRSLIDGYLGAFSDSRMKTILKPEIFRGIFNYLGSFSDANEGILNDISTYDALMKAYKEKKELDTHLGFKEKSEIKAEVKKAELVDQQASQ